MIERRQCQCNKPRVYAGSDETLCANCGGNNPFPALKSASDSAAVEGAVPDKFCRILEPDNPHFNERFACKDCGENFITMCDAARIKAQLAEAIAQRDAALTRYSNLEARYVSLSNAVGKPPALSRCPEHFADLLKERAEAAEAALATERARALQEAADECQRRGNHLMHEEGHQEGDTGAWVASDRVLDQVEGWDSAKEAILALIPK
jgi:hypothetical protein